jgi:hypothetical protein
MVTSFKFLIQASRILTDENYVDEDLEVIYELLITIDNSELNEYYNTVTILSYKNDMELYVESVKRIIRIFEEKEWYEKCHELKMKLKECDQIINKNKLIKNG